MGHVLSRCAFIVGLATHVVVSLASDKALQMAQTQSEVKHNKVRVRVCQHSAAAQEDDRKIWRAYQPDIYANFQVRALLDTPDSKADVLHDNRIGRLISKIISGTRSTATRLAFTRQVVASTSYNSNIYKPAAWSRSIRSIDWTLSWKSASRRRMLRLLEFATSSSPWRIAQSIETETSDLTEFENEQSSGDENAATIYTSASDRSNAELDLAAQKVEIRNATRRRRLGKKKQTIQHFRVGRRTRKDLDGKFPTRCLIVAKVDVAKQRVTWLEVETWVVNGFRIGDVEAGDVFNDTEDLQWTGYFDTEPYYSAHETTTPAKVKQHLLERANRGETATEPEIMDEDEVYEQKSQATMARMKAGFGEYEDPSQDPRLWFKHPWQLPTKPKMSKKAFPHSLPAFHGRSYQKEAIEAVITFVNEVEDIGLGLTHHIQALLDPREELQEVKDYIMDGDDDFDGLDDHPILQVKLYKLELWVLPQVRGCSTMYKWDDVPELFAREFCALEKDCVEADGVARLYIQAHLVPDLKSSDGGSAKSSSESCLSAHGC